jgi:glycosyltransferase involved in cell wall biosynthesis
MRKKICVLTSAHPAFDVRIFHKECKSLVAAGYEVVLIAPHHESLVRDGVRVIGTGRRKGRLARATLGVASTLIAALRENADVYHFHDPELIPAGVFLRLLGHKVIYDIHENLPKTLSYKHYLPAWIRKSLVRTVAILEQLASRSFSALITTTATVGARFAPWNSQICLVRNYPSLDEFAVSNSHAKRGRSFVYVGACITAARGAREMVEAIGLLPAHSSPKLQLAGRFDPPELQKQLQALPGWQRVEVLGYLDRVQVAEVMFRAFAGVVTIHPEPNYLEALSVKLFEYMAAGLPVIANNFPVYSDIVEEARCGLLVNSLNVQEIADAMAYLLDNPEEAREMGERGRFAVLHKFNWGKEQQNLLDLYDELLSPAARPAGVPTTRELR